MDSNADYTTFPVSLNTTQNIDQSIVSPKVSRKVKKIITPNNLITSDIELSKKLSKIEAGYGTSDGEFRNQKIVRRTKKFSMNSIIEQKESKRRVCAVAICEEIDLIKAKNSFTKNSSILTDYFECSSKFQSSMIQIKGDAIIIEDFESQTDVYIFKFGVIVFWNYTELDELNILKHLEVQKVFINLLDVSSWQKDYMVSE